MENEKKIFLVILFLNLFLLSVISQDTIYVFPQRYNHSFEYLNNKSIYRLDSINILGQYMIDPSRKGQVDYVLVNKYLDVLYPDKKVSGILCINLEGELFSQIRNNKKNTIKYKSASLEYIRLIRFVKNKLPNIQVGVYGLPFNGYYESQLMRNSDDRLDNILKEVDVLFPSLYIAYPAKQKGIEANIDYLQNNLDISFRYARRLKKTVYPFFWYLIHPSNKRYGSAFIPKDEFYIYMNFISSYQYKNEKVSGIVWWDTPTPFKNKTIKHNLLKEKINISNIDLAFEYYLFDN